MALIHQALCFGIRDYFDKHGFTKAVLGLSGGIDSAVVAALAAEALSAENVMGILMPSRYSTDHSVTDAEALAENIGMPHHTIAIKDIYDKYVESLRPVFGDLPFDVTEENLQARIRGMARSASSGTSTKPTSMPLPATSTASGKSSRSTPSKKPPQPNCIRGKKTRTPCRTMPNSTPS